MWILLSCENPLGAQDEKSDKKKKKKPTAVWGLQKQTSSESTPNANIQQHQQALAAGGGDRDMTMKDEASGHAHRQKQVGSPPVLSPTLERSGSVSGANCYSPANNTIYSPTRFASPAQEGNAVRTNAVSPLAVSSSRRFALSKSASSLAHPSFEHSVLRARNESAASALAQSTRNASRADRTRDRNHQLVAHVDYALSGSGTRSPSHSILASRRTSSASMASKFDRVYSSDSQYSKRASSTAGLVVPEISGVPDFTAATLRIIVKVDDMPAGFLARPLNEYTTEKGDLFGAPTELYLCDVPVERNRSVWVDFVSTKTNLHVTVQVNLKELGQRVPLPPQTGFASLVVDEVLDTPQPCRIGVRVNEVYCAQRRCSYPVLSFKLFWRAPDAVWLNLYVSEQLLTPESHNKKGSHPRYLFSSLRMNLPRKSGPEIMLCLYRHGKQRSQLLVGCSKFVLDKVQCTLKRPRVRSEVPILMASSNVGTLVVECSQADEPDLLNLGLNVLYKSSDAMIAAH